MNLSTIIVGLIVLAAVALALRAVLRQSKKGGCAGCSGCSGACSHAECRQHTPPEQK